MSNDMKGLVAVVTSVIGFWLNVFVEIFPRDMREVLLTGRFLQFIILVVCVWWGYSLRKAGAKYWGLIAMTLSLIGVINIILFWIGFGR